MTHKVFRPGLKYRLIFYIGGSIFATVSYMAGLWAYGVESASWGDIQVYHAIIRNLMQAFNSHSLTFFLWQVICTGIAIGIGHLLDREVYYRKKAEEKANIDGLTDLYNHRYFQDRLASEIERADRYERSLTIIMFDLDNFKNFNDTWGHQEGDRLLKWFSDLCSRCVRNIDILCRYGGEEFVVILPESDTTEALAVAERIRSATEKQSLAVMGKNKGVTVSVGIACYPAHGDTRHALILNADAALYHAKQHGKNLCFVYQEECHRSYRATPAHVKVLLANDDMAAIEALGAIVDARDNHFKGHSFAVMQSSVILGEQLRLSAEEIGNLRAAALLHDLGKIGTPESILEKPGPLKDDEWKQVENHAELGSLILNRVQEMGCSITAGVKHHHERFDGKGYPNGLAGKNIPLFARIIAIADAYDAMTSARSYRPALTLEEATEEIKQCAGSQFDPELVEMFIRMHQEHEQDKAA